MYTPTVIAMLVALTVFLGLAGCNLLFQSVRRREEILERAENQRSDPEALAKPLQHKSVLVRWADRYDRSSKGEPDRVRLRKAYLPWKPSEYRLLRFALAFGITYLGIIVLKIAPFLALSLGVAAYHIVPAIVLASRRSAYRDAFDAQLVEITQLMVNSLRAGMGIQQSLIQVAERLPEPARSEFQQVHHELLLGDSLALTLSRLRDRVESQDLSVMVNTIIVQHQAGGNLVHIFSAMTNILTERQRLAGEIRALTADARFSALIVMLMPFGMLLLLRGTPIGQALLDNPIGWTLLSIFGAVQIGIYFLIQRIARIKV